MCVLSLCPPRQAFARHDRKTQRSRYIAHTVSSSPKVIQTCVFRIFLKAKLFGHLHYYLFVFVTSTVPSSSAATIFSLRVMRRRRCYSALPPRFASRLLSSPLIILFLFLFFLFSFFFRSTSSTTHTHARRRGRAARQNTSRGAADPNLQVSPFLDGGEMEERQLALATVSPPATCLCTHTHTHSLSLTLTHTHTQHNTTHTRAPFLQLCV